MSIVELSSTVDKLARAVNQKNQELDRLKADYNEKIVQMNKYLGLLQQLVVADESTQGDSVDGTNSAIDPTYVAEITDAQFISAINGGAFVCSSCNHANSSDDYVVIPKKKIKELVQSSPELHQALASLNIKDNAPIGSGPSTTSAPAVGTERPPKGGLFKAKRSEAPAGRFSFYKKATKPGEKANSKVTCSYCNKPGHTRAKCLTRLSNPVKADYQ